MTDPHQPPASGPRATRQIEVTWGDCDAAGVVFYPRYYAWFDACTHGLLDGLGLGHHSLRREHNLIGTPLVRATADFRAAATFGEVLTAESEIVRVGARSFTVRHRMYRGETLVVEGEEVRVWAEAQGESPTGFRAVAPSPSVRARLLLQPPG